MAKKKSKKYLEAAKKVEADKAYTANEAVALVKEIDFANFDATVEVAFNLNLDTKQADQQLRGALVLPNGTGKEQTVVVGDDDLVARIQDGWLDFDVAIATPDMMAQVGRLGRVLGPKGLMPNPKTGTVTMDVAKAVSDAKSGQVTYRTDRDGNVHVPVGKVSFDEAALVGNFQAIYDTIAKLRPAAVKGTYIKHVSLASTFGPSVTLDTNSL